MRIRWVVRIVTQGVGDFDKQCEGAGNLLPLLSGAGVIQLHRSDAPGTCWDILPPGTVPVYGSREWAEKIAKGLTHIGVNAVVAPEFPVPNPPHWQDK